jgi:hypothetical protein
MVLLHVIFHLVSLQLMLQPLFDLKKMYKFHIVQVLHIDFLSL